VLALALESLWGTLADRRAEASILASLEAEIVATRSEMLRARGVHQTRCSATAELRAMFGRDVEDIDARVVGVLTRDGANITTVDPPLGVLIGLVSSGSLELISDPGLRSSLAGWPARLEDHRESEIYVHDVVRDQWVPWLVANSVLTEDWGRGDALPPDPSAARELADMMMDRDFQNLVMMQDYYCAVVLAESERLEGDIDALRAQVSQQR
jgi:hypothetical protein